MNVYQFMNNINITNERNGDNSRIYLERGLKTAEAEVVVSINGRRLMAITSVVMLTEREIDDWLYSLEGVTIVSEDYNVFVTEYSPRLKSGSIEPADIASREIAC